MNNMPTRSAQEPATIRPMTDRIVIAGLGSIGRRHLRLLRARCPGAQIMALRHKDGGDAIGGLDASTTSIEKVLEFAPQIAVIATPAPFHAQVACPLARNGTHLLIEKPVAASINDARAIADAVRETGVTAQVGYNLRFLESLNAFRGAIQGGTIGRIASVRAEVGQHLPDWREGSDWRQTVSARRDLGGGVLLELSHEFDYLSWIFGGVAGVRGWAGQQGNLDLAVEDTAHVILDFGGTMPPAARGERVVATVSLDFIRHDTVRRCVAIGDEGTLAWDAVASEVVLVRPGGDAARLHSSTPDRDAAYVAQLDAFLARVGKRGAGPGADVGEALDVLRIVDAVHRSHAAGGARVAIGR